MTIEYREFQTSLEVRESKDGDGFTVEGLLVPFNEITTGASSPGSRRAYSEQFVRGSFAKTIQESKHKVVLRPAHGGPAVGKAISLEERENGLYGTFRVSDIQAGREMLTLIRDGVTDHLSIEFQPIKHRTNEHGVVERTEVALRGVAATPHPAYASAGVTAVRAYDADDPSTHPSLAKAKARLAKLRSF